MVRATLWLSPQATPRAGIGTPRRRLPSGWKPKPGSLGLEPQARLPSGWLPSVLATLWFGYPLVYSPWSGFSSPGGLPSGWLPSGLATLRLPSLARLTGIWRTDFGFRGATLRLGYPPIRGYPLFTPRPFPRARPPPTAGYPMVMPMHAVGSSASLWPCCSCLSLVEGWLQLFG